MQIGHGFRAEANADNALATATQAAKAGRTHMITSVHASYSAAGIGLLEILDGDDVIFSQYVHNAGSFVFSNPLRATAGKAVSARLAASGVAAEIGRVSLIGVSI